MRYVQIITPVFNNRTLKLAENCLWGEKVQEGKFERGTNKKPGSVWLLAEDVTTTKETERSRARQSGS